MSAMKQLLVFLIFFVSRIVWSYVLTTNLSKSVSGFVLNNNLQTEDLNKTRTDKNYSHSLNASDESAFVLFPSFDVENVSTVTTKLLTDTKTLFVHNSTYKTNTETPALIASVPQERKLATLATNMFAATTADRNNSNSTFSLTTSGRNSNSPARYFSTSPFPKIVTRSVTLYVSTIRSRNFSTISTLVYNTANFENDSTKTLPLSRTTTSDQSLNNEALNSDTTTAFTTAPVTDDYSSRNITQDPSSLILADSTSRDFLIYILGSALAVFLVVLFYVVGCFYLYQTRRN